MTLLTERIDEQTRLLALLVGHVGRGADGALNLDPGTLVVVDRLFDGLDDLRRASLEVMHDDVDLAATAAARRAAYIALVARVRDRVAAAVAPGSRIAVITRGDAALLAVPGVEAEHLPQDDHGTWAGFHPPDGTAAVAQLEAARQRGVTHLAVPAPSRWWLDFYAELATELRLNAVVTVADDDVTLFELAGHDDGSVDGRTARYREHVARFVDLMALLLPATATVAVVSRGDDAWLAAGGGSRQHFPADDRGVYMGHPADDRDAIAALRRARDRGVGYLAIPTPMAWWAQVYPQFTEHLRRTHACVVEQAEIGAVFQLLEGPPR